jgi:hypothetical protein
MLSAILLKCAKIGISDFGFSDLKELWNDGKMENWNDGKVQWWSNVFYEVSDRRR